MNNQSQLKYIPTKPIELPDGASTFTTDEVGAARDNTKQENFVRLAESRVNYILERFRHLACLGHRGNYIYTQEQVTAIFDAISEGLADAKLAFVDKEIKHFKL